MSLDTFVETLDVNVPVGDIELPADLELPQGACGLVLFAHGTGSSRKSTRNRLVAARLRRAGLATMLMDLLTSAEDRGELLTPNLRFDIELLAERLLAAMQWLKAQAPTRDLPIGCFGASTGAAAALSVAARAPELVKAVVSRGGRPDLAIRQLGRVQAPTLLIVGGRDHEVLQLNRKALTALNCEKRLEIVPGASHLFEEPGTLEEASALATEWFTEHLTHLREAGQP